MLSLYAYAEATVPKLTVILRKAYGGAYDVMSSKHIRGDYNVAWPRGRVGGMGAEGAVQIIHRRRLQNARDSEGERGRLTKISKRSLLIHKVAALGYLDDVIEPNQTRERLCKALGMLLDKEEMRLQGSMAIYHCEDNMAEIETLRMAAIAAVLAASSSA